MGSSRVSRAVRLPVTTQPAVRQYGWIRQPSGPAVATGEDDDGAQGQAAQGEEAAAVPTRYAPSTGTWGAGRASSVDGLLPFLILVGVLPQSWASLCGWRRIFVDGASRAGP